MNERSSERERTLFSVYQKGIFMAVKKATQNSHLSALIHTGWLAGGWRSERLRGKGRERTCLPPLGIATAKVATWTFTAGSPIEPAALVCKPIIIMSERSRRREEKSSACVTVRQRQQQQQQQPDGPAKRARTRKRTQQQQRTTPVCLHCFSSLGRSPSSESLSCC